MEQPPTPEEQGLDLSRRLQRGEGRSPEVERELIILQARQAAFEYLASVGSNVVQNTLMSRALDQAMSVVRPHLCVPQPPRAKWWQRFLGPRKFPHER